MIAALMITTALLGMAPSPKLNGISTLPPEEQTMVSCMVSLVAADRRMHNAHASLESGKVFIRYEYTYNNFRNRNLGTVNAEFDVTPWVTPSMKSAAPVIISNGIYPTGLSDDERDTYLDDVHYGRDTLVPTWRKNCGF